ncbi:hypothetical protein DL96DRAFT_1454353 [Flagelloscypha sp. PMI_526]|nr:hypothetical protein DL96DRAFT_1454353 [Flagelloscypha sp. PMI_526]
MSAEKKQEKDFTSEVDAILPEAENLVKAGQLQAGLDKLFALEKQTRNAADVKSTTRLVTAIAQHTWDAKDLALLNSSISLLSKKHGQLKATVQALVELAMTWLDEIKETYGVEKWLELVETLRTVTEGKIYLETPRARVTSALSKYHEGLASSSKDPDAAKASIETASELLSDLQVETYSSMDRREKTEFILEQMRLLIAVAQRKDSDYEKSGSKTGSNGEAEWIRVRVGGRKVNEGFLTDEKNEDIKLKYYDLMIQHALHESAYLDATKYYYKIWETPSVKEDKKGKGMVTLEHIVCYIILAPHTNEQSDMLHHLHIDAELSKHPQHYELIKSFVKRELMRWPGVVELYGEFLKSTPVFKVKKHWDDLHSRVTEHNVRVISQYYSRITLPRITTLLDLSPEETEKTLSRLVVSGSIWARIDRLSGIVNFKPKRTADDIMNDWSSDMQKLLGLAEKTWMGMNAAQAAHSRALATAS